MADKITKDYALLLDNLRHALYMSENNPYTESGSVFFLDSAYNDMRGDLQDRFMKKRELGDPAFFSFEEYNNILDLYKATPEAGDNKGQINQMIFWMAHLAGWKRENFVLKDPSPTISIIFRDTKRAPKIYGQQLKQDLEKTRYKVIGGKSILYTTGASVKDGVSEGTAERSLVASEYIVMCNYHIVSEYCGEGKKQLLKKVITGFAGNIVEAERKREQKVEHSLIPNNKKEVETLCECLDLMMKAYDRLPVDETVKKDWLLARSLSWLVIGAMLRHNLSMELLEDYLKPYLPETVEHGTVEVMHTERTSENVVPSLSVQEQFWQAGKKWYEEARKPGARFHSLDIVNHILPSAENKPAGSEYCFSFRATDTDENAIQCSRFSELLRDKNSVYHQGHFMLIGEGGIGKTTTLMSAMQDTYEGKDTYNGESVIPLFVELSLAPDSQDSHAYDGTSSSVIHRLVYAMLQQKDSKKDRADLLRMCMNEESSIARDTVRELLTSAADEEIRYVFLIDGLNEVSPEPFTGRSSSAQGRILQEIREMIEGYPNVTVILTGRQGAFIDHPSFHPFYLRGLVWEEIEDYLQEKGKTDGEISLIQNGDKGLLKALSIPMFLTMYVLLRDTEGITTRGELLKVFFHERFERRKNEYDVLHRQGDISERIDQDEEQSVSGKMTRGKITLPVQWMFLDILIPEIAAQMERAHDFRISEKDVRSLLESLFKEQDSIYYGKYKEFSDICFAEQLQGEDLEDVISDFTEAYRQKAARYSAAFLKYCESSMGILYREGEKSYGFVHQHFRDYFAAVCNVNRMKIAYVAFQEDDPVTARAIMQQYDKEPLDPVLMVYIGEYLGVHHNVSIITTAGMESPYVSWIQSKTEFERCLISELLDIYRGTNQENYYSVYNLIEIMKRVRKDLSGLDLHMLDLRKCNFNKVPMDTQPGVNFTDALIKADNWFSDGYFFPLNSVSWNPDGRCIVTFSDVRMAQIWDAATGIRLHTTEVSLHSVNTTNWSPDGKRIILASNEGDAEIWDTISWELIYRLKGHTADVNYACWSPDGRSIVTSSYDKTVRIWNATSGNLVNTLEGYVGRVEVASWSPDGKYIVMLSDDKTVRGLDVVSGKLVNMGHSDVIDSGSWSPDGKNIVTFSEDKTIRVWDVPSGRLVNTMEGHTARVKAASWSPDGKSIVSASDDKTVKIWNAVSGALIHSLEGHVGSVEVASWSPDGKYIATYSHGNILIWEAPFDKPVYSLEGYVEKFSIWSPNGRSIFISTSGGAVKIWNVDLGISIFTIKDNVSWVSSVSWSPDGSRIVIGYYLGVTQVWDVASGKLIHSLGGKIRWINSADWSPDGKNIVTISYDGVAQIWDAVSGEVVHTMEGIDRGYIGVENTASWSPDGNRLVTTFYGETAQIWDTISGERVYTLQEGRGVLSASWSPDGRNIAMTFVDGTAQIWDAISGGLIFTLEANDRDGGLQKTSASWSPDGRSIVTTSFDDTARVWDAASGRLIYTLKGHTSRVKYACWSPNGKSIVTTSLDDTARVWDVASGSPLYILEGHSNTVTSANWSPDGRSIVTTSFDDTARVWDAASGSLLYILEGHSSTVTSASWSPDGSHIVTASYDRTARVWDAASGSLLYILEGHSDKVNSASWSPDGSHIVTASNDGTAKVWNSASGMLFKTFYEAPGLNIRGVDFQNIDVCSKITETQKEIFRQYGAIV